MSARDLLQNAIRLRWEKRWDEAADTLRKAIVAAEREGRSRESILLRADCQSWLGVILALRGADPANPSASRELYSEALALHEEALALVVSELGEQNVSVAESLRLIGDMQERLGDKARSLEALTRSTGIYNELGSGSPGALDALIRLSTLTFDLGRFAESARAACAYLSHTESLSRIQEAVGRIYAGRALLADGKHEEAMHHFQRGLEIAQARRSDKLMREMHDWIKKAGSGE